MCVKPSPHAFSHILTKDTGLQHCADGVETCAYRSDYGPGILVVSAFLGSGSCADMSPHPCSLSWKASGRFVQLSLRWQVLTGVPSHLADRLPTSCFAVVSTLALRVPSRCEGKGLSRHGIACQGLAR